MTGFSNKGKFSERIKNIKKRRFINKNNLDNQIKNDSNEIYNNFLKVIATIPAFVLDNKRQNKQLSNKNKINSNIELAKKFKDISNIDITLIKNSQKDYYNNVQYYNRETEFKDSCILKDNNSNKTHLENNELYNIDNKNENNKTSNLLYKDSQIDELHFLEKKIINLIKKNLIKKVNEYEVLYSELFLIGKITGDERKTDECLIILNEIKKMLCKIDKLKKQYDYLKDNFDFEYILEIDDDSLADNIIELKNKFSNNDVRGTVADYKLLDLYKFLYLRIDKLQEQTNEMEEYEEGKLGELKDRNIEFDKLKDKVINLDSINNEYINFVSNQNKFLNDLENKISKIDSRKIYSFKLQGFTDLLLNSFRYLGLVMLTPLKGLVPSIASETLITRNVVNNLYNNLEWKETTRIVYDAIDYKNDINNAVNNLDDTDRIVDTTLEDLVKLKISYNNKFNKYTDDFVEYQHVIDKINDMENKILGNKIKIEIMKKKCMDYEKINYKKLILVKSLNKNNISK